jgi:ABC-type nitrate/sulfonate/bicarbonate transport system substrate-binding protein
LNLGTTGPGAAPDALFRYLASQGRLNPDKDFQLVTIQGGGPGILAALQQGAIDGFCLSSPTSDFAVQKQDCGYLFQMALNPPQAMTEYQYIIASASEDTIRTKRDALVRYARGVALALRSINTEQDKFKAWAKQWFEGLEPAIFESAFANNGKIYFSDPMPRKNLFERNVAFINAVNKSMGAEQISSAVSYERMIDPTLVEEALKALQ